MVSTEPCTSLSGYLEVDEGVRERQYPYLQCWFPCWASSRVRVDFDTNELRLGHLLTCRQVLAVEKVALQQVESCNTVAAEYDGAAIMQTA